MAAPISHIAFAKCLLENRGKNISDHKRFLVGNSFPDIRYLKVIDRSKTHFPDISLSDISFSDNLFEGIKLHSLLDKAREEALLKSGIYERYYKTNVFTVALKLVEDEILYENINSWKDLSDMLNMVYEEELNFGISEKDIIRWHETVSAYFKVKPNDDTRGDFMLKIGFDEQIIDEINRHQQSLLSDSDLIKDLNKIYKDLLNI